MPTPEFHHLYGVTPTFLHRPRIEPNALRQAGVDAAVLGVPWEGAVTWGEWSGCVLAPRTIREASGRLSGFLPEYALDVYEHLDVADAGDVVVDLEDRESSFARIEERSSEIIAQGVMPIALGGDHAVTLPLVRSTARHCAGNLGLIILDSHLDNNDVFETDRHARGNNADLFEGDRFARNTSFRRIAELPDFDSTKMVYIGIRGGRNSRSQWEFAEQIGATVMTIADVRRDGIEACVERAIALASDGTQAIYGTVCSDALEAAFNPGGPPDPSGLTPFELCRAAYLIGTAPTLMGFDYCEVLPPQDPTNLASHTAAWTVLNLLGGFASRRAVSDR